MGASVERRARTSEGFMSPCYDGAVLGGGDGAAHPVRFEVEPAYAGRRRLSGFLRFLFALPHLVFTGGPSLLGTLLSPLLIVAGLAPLTIPLSVGAFGVITALATIVAWLVILVTGRHPRDLREVAVFYLGWRAKVVAYALLLRDDYPSFGSGGYTATLVLPPPLATRDRFSVALRLPLLIPHLPALAFLNAALTAISVVAWLAVALFGRYPRPLYDFSAAVAGYSLRLEAYLLLIHDVFPPFRLD